MPAPTSEDARMYIELMKLVQQPEMTAAWEWVLSDFEASTKAELDKKYPRGSEDRARLTRVLGFFESCGVLVSRGLLHEEVFFDAPFALEAVWPRVEQVIVDIQAKTKNPGAWENVAWLARRYERWRQDSWRPKSEAIPTDRPPTKVWGETSGHVGFTRG